MAAGSLTEDHSPQRLLFGPGRLRELSGALAGLGASRPLVVCSWRRERSEDFTRIRAALVPLVGRVPVWAGVEEHVPSAAIRAAVDRFQRERADAVVSFGGGSAVDTAKAVAHVTAFGWDGLGEGRPRRAGTVVPPHIAIPTTYSGAEASGVFFASGGTGKTEKGGPATLPAAVVADSELTVTLGSRPTAGTGIAALAHCLEALSGPRRSPFTDTLALHAAPILQRSLPAAVQRPGDPEARAGLLAASHLAGLAVAGAGAGVHRAACLALGGLTGIPHAVAAPLLLPPVVHVTGDSVPGAAARFAGAVRAGSPGEAADLLAALAAGLGLPRRLREAGVFEGDLEAVARSAADGLRGADVARPASAPEILWILRAAW